MKSIFDQDVSKLKEKLTRLDNRESERGYGSVPTAIAVDRDTLRMLTEDHDDLKKLLKAHPELEREIR